MPPLLVALTEGPDIPLNKPVLLVGRHEECDVLIPSRKISRRHCCIAQVHDYVVVKDLFSTNGVRINGIRVKEGALHAGDELTIGSYKYKIRLMAEDSDAPFNRLPAGVPQNLPSLVPADQMESCEMPMALKEDPNLGPAPRGLPLVLPVNSPKNPNGAADEPYENIRLAQRNGGEFRVAAGK